MVKELSKGQTASNSFAIIQKRENLQAKVDQFQHQSLVLMKINPSTVSLKGSHVAVQANDLTQLELDEGGNLPPLQLYIPAKEGVWVGGTWSNGI